MSDELTQLLCQAAKHKMTPEEHKAQLESFLRAEAGFGSDADEAEYAAALLSGDQDAIAKCEAAAQERIAAALRQDEGDDGD